MILTINNRERKRKRGKSPNYKKSKHRSKYNGKGKLKCWYFGMKGHSKNDCWSWKGYRK